MRRSGSALGKKRLAIAHGNYMGMQPASWADAALREELTGYRPQTKGKEGIAAFVK